MKPQHFDIRADRNTGDIWLTYEKPRERMKRIKNITAEVLSCLSADLLVEGGSKISQRDMLFSDGATIRFTIEDLGVLEPEFSQ